MASDMTLPIDNGYVNVRVGAIIMQGDRFLMVGNDQSPYLYSVGGRLHFGETAEEAVIREVFEETGIRMEIDRLGFVHENYFVADWQARRGKLYYEISFYFYMKTPEDFSPCAESFTEGGNLEHLVWVTPDSEVRYYPEFFRTELKAPSHEVKHFVTDERQKAEL